jgi:predicted pyridoxine 5'-phosphate oxidase superfamily flavin-nucleotide-binding protein
MSRKYAELTSTPAVQAAQLHHGVRTRARPVAPEALDDDPLTAGEIDFIAQRDGFYMASVNQDGWPYVQFRGGPAGFLKALDERTLAFADFRGNRQYISTGNLTADDRVSLFFMDYANRRRLKLMARAEILDAAQHPELARRLIDPDYPAHVERLVRYHVVAFDWNCPQHITPRYTLEEFAAFRHGPPDV